MSNSLATGYATNIPGTAHAASYDGQSTQHPNVFENVPFQMVERVGDLVTERVVGPAIDQGLNFLQQSYRNYMQSAPSYIQTDPLGAPPRQSISTSTPQSYMPVQNGGLPGQMNVVNNGLVSPGPGTPLQPDHAAPSPLDANPAAHVIDSRSVLDEIHPTQSPHYVSWIELYNLTPYDFARLAPDKQQYVNAAIERSFPGLHSQAPELVGNNYIQYTLSNNNLFDPAAAQRFTGALTESYKPYDPESNHYHATAAGLHDLGRHLKQTTEALQSRSPQIPPEFVRRALWEKYKLAAPEIRSASPFNYGGISANSIYDRAQTFQTVDGIQRFYGAVTETQIAGTNRLYEPRSNCPSGGLINWRTVEDLERNAPGGLFGARSDSHWYNPWSWGTKTPCIEYEHDVRTQFLNGRVVGVLGNQYTLDGVTWKKRTSNEAIRRAQDLGMWHYMNRQKKFFESGNGNYPNCNRNDVETLSALNPGDVVPLS